LASHILSDTRTMQTLLNTIIEAVDSHMQHFPTTACQFVSHIHQQLFLFFSSVIVVLTVVYWQQYSPLTLMWYHVATCILYPPCNLVPVFLFHFRWHNNKLQSCCVQYFSHSGIIYCKFRSNVYLLCLHYTVFKGGYSFAVLVWAYGDELFWILIQNFIWLRIHRCVAKYQHNTCVNLQVVCCSVCCIKRWLDVTYFHKFQVHYSPSPQQWRQHLSTYKWSPSTGPLYLRSMEAIESTALCHMMP
jgi:hypothetical protein